MNEIQPARIIGSAPVFLVADIVKSAEYYRDVFGFSYSRLWGEPTDFCMPSRDNLIVMLSLTKSAATVQPNGNVKEALTRWDAYFWIDDADKLFNEFNAKGAKIVYEPTIKKYYNMKEFAVKDLNGYILAFGQHWSDVDI
jgi:predicted lactoylglutathione lyase